MDADRLYNAYLSGDPAALESLMELYGDRLTLYINGYVKNVGFVALCTPILAYAGVSIGKDLDAFAKTGWRIVILAIVVFVGTYIASAIIAQCILKALGQI